MTLAKEMLVELINRTNGTSLPPSTLRIATPHRNSNEAIDRDTYCVVSGIFKEGFFGSKRYYYNRLDLAKIFNKIDPAVRSEPTVIESTHDVIPLLIERYGLRIEPSDVVKEPLDTTELPVTFTLRAADKHAWIGEVQVTIVPDGPPFLRDVVLNLDLGDINLDMPELLVGDLGDLKLS